jgi:hypothetical protein
MEPEMSWISPGFSVKRRAHNLREHGRETTQGRNSTLTSHGVPGREPGRIGDGLICAVLLESQRKQITRVRLPLFFRAKAKV